MKDVQYDAPSIVLTSEGCGCTCAKVHSLVLKHRGVVARLVERTAGGRQPPLLDFGMCRVRHV